MTVAAIIPSLPERSPLLAQAAASVEAQTRPVDELHIGLDDHREGPAVVRNRLVDQAATEWVAFLDDDDLWLPHHIETALAHADHADVIYTDCDLTGPHHSPTVNQDFDPFTLEIGNYIPITAVVRRTAFHAAGGFDPDDRYEDWQLWRRMSANGARFVHVPTVTWRYRFGEDLQRTFA